MQRGGISFHATKTDPGYKGKLTFGIKNQGKNKFVFELGARMFNIEFEPVIGEIKRVYSGQHQGGRVTSGGKILNVLKKDFLLEEKRLKNILKKKI